MIELGAIKDFSVAQIEKLKLKRAGLGQES